MCTSGSFYLDIWRVDTRVEPFGDSTLLDDLHHCIQWVLEGFGRTAATVWKFGAHVSAHEASGVSSGGGNKKASVATFGFGSVTLPLPPQVPQ